MFDKVCLATFQDSVQQKLFKATNLFRFGNAFVVVTQEQQSNKWKQPSEIECLLTFSFKNYSIQVTLHSDT